MSWRPFESNRDTEREALRRQSEHPKTCVCGGAGWLWGLELKEPEYECRDQRYLCDRTDEDRAEDESE